MRIRLCSPWLSLRAGRLSLLACALILSVVSISGYAQVSLSTGGIQGTVTDPSGAVVPGAKVVLTRPSTGSSQMTTTGSSGLFNFGTLVPGEYRIHVEAVGFSQVNETITVQVGNIANGNVQLSLTGGTQVVSVSASAVTINTDQATVQGVLDARQIQQLPINGRNFLDLAQLEPGVQIQDGQNFDPTKAGYSSISFGGRFGRTARIEVDGVDVSDETVGTTTTDIPSSSIQEFQVAQSDLDISTELTSSGTVNVTTKTGTNRLHGEAFGFFRDYRMAAALPHPSSLPAPYFQRSQYGGSLGGPLWKDKLFLFGDGERTKQDEQSPVLLNDPFTALSGNFPTPFREGIGLGRLDANVGKGVHAFYRYNLYHSAIDATFGFGYQAYTSKNQTFEHVVGVDFTTGSFSHSLRYSYLKFENQIVDAVRGSNLPFATSPVSIDIGSLYLGTNFLAPQATPQNDDIIKYDGSWLKGSNIVRYGFSFNHNQAGGTADFYGLNPTVTVTPGASEIAAANAGPFPALFANDPNGRADNPNNYPAETVTISNDVGYSTEIPGLGYPGGLLGPDNRIGIYLGDSWKPKPNITLELALRYVRDTGRTDSDLPTIPIINQYFPGYGNRVNNPNTNLAPQFGAVWDPFKKGLTVIRAGAGLYYENIIYNNVLFDRPLRLTHGSFLNVQDACFSSAPATLATSSGSITPAAGLCGGYIGQVASGLAAFEQAFIAGNPPNPANPNGAFVGNDLTGGFDVGTETTPSGLFAPNFKTPRSLQLNIGVQQQLHRGLVLTADYLRNVETHSLLNVDLNHVGDAGYFNAAGAAAAITATEAMCGATSVQGAINNCPADVDGTGHADINDFAANGLTTSWEFGGSATPPTPAAGSPLNGCPPQGCAFGGINPALGTFYSMQSIGRSVYNGLDLKLVGDISHPFTGLRRFNTQVAYSLSRFINTGGWNAGGGTGNSDQDFVISAVDNRHPLSYAGPSLLDRTHQLSFGFIADIPAKFQVSSTAHFYSGLAQSLNLQPNGNLGEIFRTDITGDGTTQDLLPGTKIGAFGRSVSAGGLNQRINSFNSTYGGQATPAGQALINNNIFTLPQLQAIGATVQPIANAPAGQVGMSPLKALDMKVSWVGAFWHERFSLTPSAGFYNLFNFANFDLPGTTLMNGQLQNAAAPGQTVTPGFVNSTTYAQRVTDRVGVGTGVFGLGSPRALEFGLDLNF